MQFVEWGDGNSTLAVPTCWLFNHLPECRRYCYFPRKSIKKAIRKKDKPTDSWDVFVVKQLSSKDIPTYEKAIRKEKKSIITSALDTSTDDEKRRKRTRPTRYSTSEEPSDCGECDFILFPALKGKGMFCVYVCVLACLTDSSLVHYSVYH